MNYDNETPMNDKFLMADGSIRNANGQIVQSANEYWKQRYKQATPIPAKFLHADGTIDENIGGGSSGTSLKYHLYAWDYSSGFCVGYTEKEVPVAGDLLFLKQDMEEGKITDPIELKMIYHVVSDADGVITVSEHPEGASGYTFTRNPDDDYEETITDIRDCVDVTENGLLTSQKGTVFKSANVNVEGGGSGGSGITVEPITITQNGTTTAPSGKAYSPITVNVPKEVVLSVPVLPDGFTIEKNASQGGSLVIRSSTAFSYFSISPTSTYKDGHFDVTEGSLGNTDRNDYICIFRDSNYNTLIGMGRWRDYEALAN